MTPTAPEALVTGALVLVHDHADLLTSEAQRRAQRRQLEEVAALLADPEQPVRAAVAATIFGKLVDCTARLERASADAPGLLRVKDRLRSWRADLELARDVALTRSLRKGPARRRERTKLSRWNPPSPA